jgi:peptidoglycan/LPS O-acetylase OafA/YrhL
MEPATARPQSSPGGSAGFRFSENNFDLIRLVAAVEVAIRHTIVNLSPEQFPYWMKVFFAFVPGVPIFFFLSGYLISRSWERSPSGREYFRNRALRLFPALWCCVLFATAAIFASGYMSTVAWQPAKLVAWMVGQGTVFQFWTPDFLRDFGVGAVNGSLWSISVEIQFYVVTAALYWSMRGLPPVAQTVVIGGLAVLFSTFNGQRVFFEDLIEASTGSWHAMKLFGVSFLPWYFMFLCGAFAQRVSGWLVPLCVQSAPVIFALYVASMLVDFHFWGLGLGNDIPPYLVPLMGVTVLAAAYSRPTLGHRLLRGQDMSYGMYIYHMPIVNVFIQLGKTGSAAWIVVALLLSGLCAALSWLLVERPFLRRKKAALRPVPRKVGT